jgi:hypothetical protein
MQEFKRHTVWYCFAGETEVITKQGYKKFKDIVDTKQLLLMKDGSWKEAPIKHFGQQSQKAFPNPEWSERLIIFRDEYGSGGSPYLEDFGR